MKHFRETLHEIDHLFLTYKQRGPHLEFLEKADAGDREPFYLFIANHVKLSLTTSNQSP